MSILSSKRLWVRLFRLSLKRWRCRRSPLNCRSDTVHETRSAAYMPIFDGLLEVESCAAPRTSSRRALLGSSRRRMRHFEVVGMRAIYCGVHVQHATRRDPTHVLLSRLQGCTRVNPWSDVPTGHGVAMVCSFTHFETLTCEGGQLLPSKCPAPGKAGMMYSDQTDKRGESHDDQWNLMDKREGHYPVTFRRRLVISCIT
jgi:hypothetical protein